MDKRQSDIEKAYSVLKNEMFRTDNKELRDALKTATIVLGSFEQLVFERDIAIAQLNDIGISFGESVESVKKCIKNT